MKYAIQEVWNAPIENAGNITTLNTNLKLVELIIGNIFSPVEDNIFSNIHIHIHCGFMDNIMYKLYTVKQLEDAWENILTSN